MENEDGTLEAGKYADLSPGVSSRMTTRAEEAARVPITVVVNGAGELRK